jgi:DNA-binding NarL/FixJ family response regulator
MSTIKIAIADDRNLFRQGIHVALAQEEELEVVPEAINRNELLDNLILTKKALRMPDGISHK